MASYLLLELGELVLVLGDLLEGGLHVLPLQVVHSDVELADVDVLHLGQGGDTVTQQKTHLSRSEQRPKN